MFDHFMRLALKWLTKSLEQGPYKRHLFLTCCCFFLSKLGMFSMQNEHFKQPATYRDWTICFVTPTVKYCSNVCHFIFNFCLRSQWNIDEKAVQLYTRRYITSSKVLKYFREVFQRHSFVQINTYNFFIKRRICHSFFLWIPRKNLTTPTL